MRYSCLMRCEKKVDEYNNHLLFHIKIIFKMKSIGQYDELGTDANNLSQKLISSYQKSSSNCRIKRRKTSFRFLSIVAILAFLLIIASLSDVVNAAKDYYKIMGVDRKADERTIKKAYRVSDFRRMSCAIG